MSDRLRTSLVNTAVAVVVAALLHVFFFAVPSRLAERVEAPPAAEVAPGPATAPETVAEAPSSAGGTVGAPGVPAAPDRH
jgi:hypothetical protein